MVTTPIYYETTSFRSLNFPDRFIRHKNFLLELDPIVSVLEMRDASFRAIPGFRGWGRDILSFQSANFHDRFLRHQNFRLRLDQNSHDSLFWDDSTFIVVPGNADSSMWSFRSWNFRNKFWRHRNFQLVLEELDLSNELDRKDSTFAVERGFVAFG